MDMIPQKHCNGCNQNKPATSEYFDHQRNQCKQCRNAQSRKRWAKNHPPNIDILPEGHKRCTHCKEVKPATTDYFFANKGLPDKLNCWCKKCRKEWGKEHPDLNYNPTWRKNYYEINKEKTIKEQCAYAKTEAGKATRKQYKKAHPEAVRTHTRNRRAVQKSLPGTHTEQDILTQYQRQKGKCYYCNQKIPQGKHQIDHTFPVTRDNARNSIDHLVVTCGTCNRKKGDKYPWEWPEGGRLL